MANVSAVSRARSAVSEAFGMLACELLVGLQ